MIAPLLKNGLFGVDTSFFIALIIGIMFGYLLEKGGFGNARKIVSQFYFTDFSVLKVMFTSIIVAMLGILYLNWIGVLDISQIYITPTFVTAQLVGGAFLGLGFAIGGLCPGTSFVSAITGKIDGMVFLLGIFVGTMSFGDIFYEWLEPVYKGGSLGKITVPEFFGIDTGIVAFLIVVMAIGSFWLAEKTERDWDPYKKLRSYPKEKIGVD
ncbi:MAG: YeeE/YedE thiosulfate transporter family protein [Melioribacteraceae bacterium]